ncbi:hypothetical protein DFJ74DRAFT_692561 [Hyaloraphidium curvatum]|nr:hypothetical protein DFJ74DRAFT_692561 [Hyaloraphidium curvatum]
MHRAPTRFDAAGLSAGRQPSPAAHSRRPTVGRARRRAKRERRVRQTGDPRHSVPGRGGRRGGRRRDARHEEALAHAPCREGSGFGTHGAGRDPDSPGGRARPVGIRCNLPVHRRLAAKRRQTGLEALRALYGLPAPGGRRCGSRAASQIDGRRWNQGDDRNLWDPFGDLCRSGETGSPAASSGRARLTVTGVRCDRLAGVDSSFLASRCLSVLRFKEGVGCRKEKFVQDGTHGGVHSGDVGGLGGDGDGADAAGGHRGGPGNLLERRRPVLVRDLGLRPVHPAALRHGHPPARVLALRPVLAVSLTLGARSARS